MTIYNHHWNAVCSFRVEEVRYMENSRLHLRCEHEQKHTRVSFVMRREILLTGLAVNAAVSECHDGNEHNNPESDRSVFCLRPQLITPPLRYACTVTGYFLESHLVHLSWPLRTFNPAVYASVLWQRQSHSPVLQRVLCVFRRDLSSHRVPERCCPKVVAAWQREME